MPLAPEEKIAKFWEEQQAAFDHAAVLTQQVEELQRTNQELRGENRLLRARLDHYSRLNSQR